ESGEEGGCCRSAPTAGEQDTQAADVGRDARCGQAGRQAATPATIATVDRGQAQGQDEGAHGGEDSAATRQGRRRTGRRAEAAGEEARRRQEKEEGSAAPAAD